MNKFKKITYFWILSIIIFIIFNIIMFYGFTNKVYPLTSKTTIGDFGRMSYVIDVLQEKENINNLTKRHISHNEYNGEKIELLTIGDSFSNGGAGGTNSYYQDYIATIYDKNVLNINAQKIENTTNYIEIVSLLANSGFLEQMGVKYVLIESVQRESLVRFAKKDIDFSLKSNNSLENIFKSSKKTYEIEEAYNYRPTIINNLNLNAFLYNVNYYIKGYGKINSSVYVEKLNKELFTSTASSKLLFFHEDLKKMSLETKENIELLNDNLNTLSNILKAKNIKLIYMPAVDKYNLYRPYIISNQYSESMFFEYLTTLEKDYVFIDTKNILSELLDNNFKDVFYSDDTHWSYVASETIVRNKVFNDLFKK